MYLVHIIHENIAHVANIAKGLVLCRVLYIMCIKVDKTLLKRRFIDARWLFIYFIQVYMDRYTT